MEAAVQRSRWRCFARTSVTCALVSGRTEAMQFGAWSSQRAALKLKPMCSLNAWEQRPHRGDTDNLPARVDQPKLSSLGDGGRKVCFCASDVSDRHNGTAGVKRKKNELLE